MSRMALPKHLRTGLAVVIGAAGVYSVAYTAFGANWFKMNDTDLARVNGCYAVAGQKLFRISDRTLVTSALAIGIEGAHEKDREVLVLDRPVRLARSPMPHLAEQGNLTKLPIIEGEPVRLELWDETNRRVEAVWTDCTS